MVNYNFKKIDSIIYYFTGLIDAHVIKGPIIVQVYFDYLESQFIKIGKYINGVHEVKKESRQEDIDQG